jgi:hypothetical protein
LKAALRCRGLTSTTRSTGCSQPQGGSGFRATSRRRYKAASALGPPTERCVELCRYRRCHARKPTPSAEARRQCHARSYTLLPRRARSCREECVAHPHQSLPFGSALPQTRRVNSRQARKAHIIRGFPSSDWEARRLLDRGRPGAEAGHHIGHDGVMQGDPFRYSVRDSLPAHHVEVVQGSRVDPHPTSMIFRTKGIPRSCPWLSVHGHDTFVILTGPVSG